MTFKSFICGLLIGLIAGGAGVAAYSTQSRYQFIPLAQGNFSALKIDKQTGHAWVLTSLGKWLLTVDDVENMERRRQTPN
jgi:hypothetical protein